MTIYYAECLDECGTEASLETQASNESEAAAYFKEQYPDMRILDVYSAAEYRAREAVRWRRLEREMDYDY